MCRIAERIKGRVKRAWVRTDGTDFDRCEMAESGGGFLEILSGGLDMRGDTAAGAASDSFTLPPPSSAWDALLSAADSTKGEFANGPRSGPRDAPPAGLFLPGLLFPGDRDLITLAACLLLALEGVRGEEDKLLPRFTTRVVADGDASPALLARAHTSLFLEF
jgi:hypothetical protein